MRAIVIGCVFQHDFEPNDNVLVTLKKNHPPAVEVNDGINNATATTAPAGTKQPLSFKVKGGGRNKISLFKMEGGGMKRPPLFLSDGGGMKQPPSIEMDGDGMKQPPSIETDGGETKQPPLFEMDKGEMKQTSFV